MFANNKNIEIIKGNSVSELPKLIKKNKNKRILFFLDAHYSGGKTGQGEIEVPILQELMIIANDLENTCSIIIDDADLFEYADNTISWKGINEKNILSSLDDRIERYFYIQNTVKALDKSRLVIKLNKKI